MALSGLLPVRGVLGVARAPRDLDEVRSAISDAPARQIRLYLVVGYANGTPGSDERDVELPRVGMLPLGALAGGALGEVLGLRATITLAATGSLLSVL